MRCVASVWELGLLPWAGESMELSLVVWGEGGMNKGLLVSGIPTVPKILDMDSATQTCAFWEQCTGVPGLHMEC